MMKILLCATASTLLAAQVSTKRKLNGPGVLKAIIAAALLPFSPTSEAQPFKLASCNGQLATLACSPGAPSCQGTAGNDIIAGSSGPDVIDGRGGNDLICGGNGDDVIRGGRGNDTLFGGRGRDRLLGGRGNDFLHGERGMDSLYGQAGDDELRGGRHDDFLHGNAGNDFCVGGPGNDTRCPCEAEAHVELFCPTVTKVTPETTDAAIDNPVGGDHFVYVNPHVPERYELLVHLPGTGGTPENNTAFLEHVAHQGMKAIGLQYVNNGSVMGLCSGDPDPDCPEKLRLVRIYGDENPLGSVSQENSLVHRLVKLLEWLHAQQPMAGWDNYLIDGAPRWDLVVISGHSQGSGMAALIARDQAVARVLMFGGPSDLDPTTFDTAAWITDPKTTPINRHFGFRHINDQPLLIPRAWDDMLLPGPPVIVNAGAPPYGGSHYLETDANVPAGQTAHGSVIHNSAFSATWTYMCCSP